MMDLGELKQSEEKLCMLMNERLGLSQHSLDKAVKRAGRRLPVRQNRHAQVVIEALRKADHPALFAQISEQEVRTAVARLTEHLEGINRQKQQIDAAIKVTSGLAFNLLVLVAIVIVILSLRGFV